MKMHLDKEQKVIDGVIQPGTSVHVFQNTTKEFTSHIIWALCEKTFKMTLKMNVPLLWSRFYEILLLVMIMKTQFSEAQL